MRALVISSVIGALALSGCQSMNTGTGTGGIRDYDKAAIGANHPAKKKLSMCRP